MATAGTNVTVSSDLVRQYQLWREISTMIAQDAGREEVLARLVTAGREFLGSAVVAVFVLDRLAATLELLALDAQAGVAGDAPAGGPRISVAGGGGWFADALDGKAHRGEALAAADEQTRRYLQQLCGLASGGLHATMLPLPGTADARGAGVLFVAGVPESLEPGGAAFALLEFVAAQAGLALQHTTLSSRVRASADRLSAVNEIARVLINTLNLENLEELYRAIHRQVAGALATDAFFIALYDRHDDLLRFPYVYDDGRLHVQQEQRAGGAAPCGLVIRTRQPVIYETREQISGQLVRHFGNTERSSASALFVPMLTGDQVIGIVSAQCYRERAYSAEDLQLLVTIADQAAVAIENARLYQEIRQRLQRLSILHEVALAATSSLDFDLVIREAVGALQRSSGLENVRLALLSARGDRLVIHAAYHSAGRDVDPGHEAREARETSIAAGEGLMGWVVQTGLPARVDDVRADARFTPAMAGSRSVLCVPLKLDDRTIGVISAESRQVGMFSLEDEQLLTIVAGQLAPLVDRARLYAESQRRVHELGVLYDAGMATAALLEPRLILQAVVQHMARAVDASSAYIGDWDEELGTSHTVAEYFGPRARDAERVSNLGQGYAITDFPRDAEDIRSGKPFRLSAGDPRVEAFQRDRLRRYGAQCALVIPLLSKQEVLGYVELWESGRDRAWTPDEIRLCQTIAVQATTALEKARLFEETRQRVAELTALQDITTRLTLSLELADVLDAVAASAVRLVRPTDVHIYLWNAATESFSFGTALWQDGSHKAAVVAPREDGLTMRVVRSGEPIIINDVPHHPLFSSPEQSSWGLQAISGFPLIHAGEVIGAFTVAFLDPHVFSPDELRLLEIFADHASIAVRNARLYEEARQRAAELATLQRSSLELTASLDLRTVLDSITENALRLVQARDVHLYVYDDEVGEFTLGVARWDVSVPHTEVHIPRREGLTAQVVREHRPIIINNTEGHPSFSNSEALAWGIKSIAGFPLKRADRLLGVFNVAFRTLHTFTPEELRVLTILGDQAAVAIDNARAYEEARRRAEQVSALLATTAVISSTLDLDVRLQTIAEKAKGLVSADGCTLFSLEDDGAALRPLVAIHPYQQQVEAMRIKVGESLTGRVALTGVGEIVNHAQNDPGIALVPGTPDDPECLVSVPLAVGERVIGVMTLQRNGEREFTRADLDLLSSFASQAAIAIDTARLYHEIKVRAQTLQRAYDELAEADRLKDELVQNVSHELRTPLTFIKGYVELLVSGELGRLEPEQHDSLKIVLAKTDVLVRLVSDVVSLQAISAESLELVEADPRDAARRALAGVEPAAQRAGVTLDTQFAPDIPLVFADVDRLAQVFDNLLGNALKFSPEGGVITVRMRPDGDRVRVEVQDCGIGIPADKHKRIFERFYQVDGTTTRRFGGAGLGLAISKQIVEAHHGEIGVAWSEPGQGTTFYFTLVAVLHNGQAGAIS